MDSAPLNGILFPIHDVDRTFSLGKPDRRWTDLMDKSAGCAEAVVRAVKPGDPWTKVQEVADRYVDGAGIRKWVWWVGGYALSQTVPPDWIGTLFVDPNEGIADRPLDRPPSSGPVAMLI